ncbi:MAG: hypothetical protein F6K18_30305 [Okeania sp. SIO2C2]|nr:hypothetical protein [Okeania sp. SIO2C2]
MVLENFPKQGKIKIKLYKSISLKKEEGRRKKWMGIVNDLPLCIYKPQPIVNTV